MSAGNRWRLNEIDFTKYILRQRRTAELPETFYRLPDSTLSPGGTQERQAGLEPPVGLRPPYAPSPAIGASVTAILDLTRGSLLDAD